MNVFELFAVLKLNSDSYKQELKSAESEGESLSSKIGTTFKNMASTVGTALATASAAAAGAVVALSKSSIEAYANYEQLIGGVETLFGESSDLVVLYANNAYKTAGMSANEYMELATSFSASLLQSLNGDTVAAAEYTQTAISDMSDNINKFGSSAESVQNAYSSFARGQYTLLDNLKLGYAGTKSEMERLITDAEALDSTFTAARDTNGDLSMSYADIVDAIHIVQSNMKITGTTTKEASTTISGSIGQMKSAWQNFVTGLGDSNVSIKSSLDDLMETIDTVVDNVEPVIETILNNIAAALPGAFSKLLNLITNNINTILPNLLTAVKGIITSLAQSLPQMASTIIQALPSLLSSVISGLGDVLGDLLPSLVSVIGDVLANLPALLVGIVDGIFKGATSFGQKIYDSIKESLMDSVPEDLSDGFVGKIESNFGQALTQAATNLQLAYANAIGDQDWASALNNLNLAFELEEKIKTDYNTAKANIEKYSFENFKIETETTMSTAMSLLGALQGMMDENGVVTAPIEVVQSYIDQINALLGTDDAVVLDESLAEWIIDIVDKYKDENGNYTDPASIKADIVEELNKIFGGEEGAEAIELAEQTYKAVSKVLSGYTYSQAVTDKETIRQSIEDELKLAGVPEATAKAIANASIEEGAITTWYTTAESSEWNDSSFINWLQVNGYLPTAGKSAKADAIAEVATKFILGEIDKEEFKTELKALDLTEEEASQIVTCTVDYSQVTSAIAEYEKLVEEQYKTSLISAFTDSQVANTQNYLQAVNQAYAAQMAFNDGITGTELTAYNEQLNAATMAMNAQEAEAKLMYAELYNLSGGYDVLGVSESEWVAERVAGDASLQAHKGNIAEMRAETALYAGELMNTAGSYANLDSAGKAMIDTIISTAGSWDEVTTAMELNSSEASALKDVYSMLKTDGVEANSSSVAHWVASLTDSEEGLKKVSAACLALGVNDGQLADILTNLAKSEELAADASESSAKKHSRASKTVQEEVGTAATKIGTDLTAASDSVTENMGLVNAALDSVDASTAETELEEFATNADNSTNNADVMGANTAEGMNEVITEIQANIEAVGTAFDGIRLKAVDTLGTDSALMTYLGLVGGRIINKITNGVNDNLATFTSAIGSFSSIIYNQAGEMYSAGLNIGYYAGQGLANGLYSMWNYVYSAASSLAQAAKLGATVSLKVQSPSKVFTEIGQYVGEGLAIGIENMNDMVADASSNMADIVTANMNPSIGYDVSVSNSNTALEDKMDEVVNAIRGMEISIDGRTLVGEIIEDVDSELGRLNARVQRGGYAYV